MEEIKKGNNTVSAISKAIEEPEYFVRESLSKLARKRLVKIDKTHRPYRLFSIDNLKNEKLTQMRVNNLENGHD